VHTVFDATALPGTGTIPWGKVSQVEGEYCIALCAEEASQVCEENDTSQMPEVGVGMLPVAHVIFDDEPDKSPVGELLQEP
jgi:hypothetical protein